MDTACWDGDTTDTLLNRVIDAAEIKPRNTMWVPYLWTPGMFEKTTLREHIRKNES